MQLSLKLPICMNIGDDPLRVPSLLERGFIVSSATPLLVSSQFVYNLDCQVNQELKATILELHIKRIQT